MNARDASRSRRIVAPPGPMSLRACSLGMVRTTAELANAARGQRGCATIVVAHGGHCRRGRAARRGSCCREIGEEIVYELERRRNLRVRSDYAHLLTNRCFAGGRRYFIVVDFDESPRSIAELANSGTSLSNQAAHLVFCDGANDFVLSLDVFLRNAGVSVQNLVDQRKGKLYLGVSAGHPQLLARLRCAWWGRLILVVNLDEGTRGIPQPPNGGTPRSNKSADLRFGE
eukprot:scaffold104843_cov31-Tisochrysis_lutea.AAC.4